MLDHPIMTRQHPVGIVSAENPRGPAAGGPAELEQEVARLGYPFERAEGRYGGQDEHSLVIHHIPADQLAELGRRYGQESVLHVDPVDGARLLYVLDQRAGRWHPEVPSQHRAWRAGDPQIPEDDRTVVPGRGGVRFGFDFDRLDGPAAQPARAAKSEPPEEELVADFAAQLIQLQKAEVRIQKSAHRYVAHFPNFTPGPRGGLTIGYFRDPDQAEMAVRAVREAHRGGERDPDRLREIGRRAAGQPTRKMGSLPGRSLRKKAPPGREDQVRALKGKVRNPYAVAWASHNRSEMEKFEPGQQLGGGTIARSPTAPGSKTSATLPAAPKPTGPVRTMAERIAAKVPARKSELEKGDKKEYARCSECRKNKPKEKTYVAGGTRVCEDCGKKAAGFAERVLAVTDDRTKKSDVEGSTPVISQNLGKACKSCPNGACRCGGGEPLMKQPSPVRKRLKKAGAGVPTAPKAPGAPKPPPLGAGSPQARAFEPGGKMSSGSKQAGQAAAGRPAAPAAGPATAAPKKPAAPKA